MVLVFICMAERFERMSGVHKAFPRKNLYFTEFMADEPYRQREDFDRESCGKDIYGGAAELEPECALRNRAANPK
jgi:hypothetical protein